MVHKRAHCPDDARGGRARVTASLAQHSPLAGLRERENRHLQFVIHKLPKNTPKTRPVVVAHERRASEAGRGKVGRIDRETKTKKR